MVRQAAKGLSTNDVFVSALHQLDHFGGQQPAFAHLGPQGDNALGFFHQFTERAGRIEAAFAHGIVHSAADGIHPVQQLIRRHCLDLAAAVQLHVQRHVGNTVFHKAHQAGQVHFAVLAFQEFFQIVVAQGRILDVNFAHNANLDFRHAGNRHRSVRSADDGELAFHIMHIVVDALVHPALDGGDPLFGQGISGAGLVLIGLGLAAQGHQQVAVIDAGNDLAYQRQGQRQAAAFFQAGKVQRCHRDITVPGLNQRFAQQLDVVGCTATAARLGNEQRGMVQIILAGVQRVNKLTDDQQRRVAGIVVNIFQAKLGDLAAAVAQNFHIIALALQRSLQQPELGNGHIGDQNLVGLDHILGKIGGHVFHKVPRLFR